MICTCQRLTEPTCSCTDPQFGFQDADLQQSEVEADAMFNYVIEIRNGVSFDPFLPVIRQLQVISQDVSATGETTT